MVLCHLDHSVDECIVDDLGDDLLHSPQLEPVDTPAVLGPKAACVDYSAGKGGPLVAYQWSGETELVDGHFVSFG